MLEFQVMSHIFALIILNILFVGAIWHMDVNHNLDRLEGKTRGIFRIKPETGFRLSEYVLVLILVLIDLLFLFA